MHIPYCHIIHYIDNAWQLRLYEFDTLFYIIYKRIHEM